MSGFYMAKLNPRTTISRPKPKKPVKPVPKVARKVVVADKAKRKLPPPPVVKVKEKEPEKGKEKPRLAKAPVAPNGRPAAEASTPDAQSVIASIGTIKSQSGIDLTEKIKELVRLAQEQGYLTYNDINDALPDTMISPEELDEIYIKLRNLEVEIVDQAEVDRVKQPEPEEEDDKARLDILDDPVRMYLKQMGQVPLLTREQEVEISKRIEDAENEVKRIIYSFGFSGKEHIALAEAKRLGAFAYLQKPVDIEKLIVTLKNAYKQKLEDAMVAASFAEEGEFQMAQEIMDKDKKGK